MTRVRVIYDEPTKAGMFMSSAGYDSAGLLHVHPYFSLREPWYVRWVSKRRPFWRRLVKRSTAWRRAVQPVGLAATDFETGDEGYMIVEGVIRL